MNNNINNKSSYNKQHNNYNIKIMSVASVSSYKYEFKTIKIKSFVNYIKRNNIDFAPLYQREFVWDDKMKIDFIDSIMIGIMVPQITINVHTNENINNGDNSEDSNEESDAESDEDNNEDNNINANIIDIHRNTALNMTCIDGKHRTRAILDFYENKIQYNDSYYKNMNNNIKQIFNNALIPVVFYKNLNYVMQIDIFSRVQMGKSLTDGEKIISYISDDMIANEFKKMCIKLKTYFQYTDRDEYILDISHVLCMNIDKQCKHYSLDELIRCIKDNISIAIIESFCTNMIAICSKINFCDIIMYPDVLTFRRITCCIMHLVYYQYIHQKSVIKTKNLTDLIQKIKLTNNKYIKSMCDRKIIKPQETCEYLEDLFKKIDIPSS